MKKEYCDRCKEEIGIWPINKIECKREEMAITKELFEKKVCEKCMNDLINIMDYECSRYKLVTKIVLNSEVGE